MFINLLNIVLCCLYRSTQFNIIVGSTCIGWYLNIHGIEMCYLMKQMKYRIYLHDCYTVYQPILPYFNIDIMQ
jgi:hypothetical protein